MEHMPKSTQRVGVFRNFLKVPMVLFCHHGTFVVIIMLKFVSNIRYTVKKINETKKINGYKIC